MSCIFCQIAEKAIPASVVYENDQVICFRDVNPVAPVHVLVVPKQHFEDLLDLNQSAESQAVMQSVMEAISQVVSIAGMEPGFRLINNCREDGGQTVMHLHFHLIGGHKLPVKLL